MKKFFFIMSLIAFCNSLFGQSIENMNFAVASHPMKVNKIEYLPNQTKIEISIENQIQNGNFCADKNIDLVDIINKNKLHLVKSEGIPVCPSNYRFSFIGEVLTFTLIFPKIPTTSKYINIIENCSQYCFSIKGIILNAEMNKEINLGYEYYSKGKLDFALSSFRLVVEKNKDYPFGFLYFNIIQILVEQQDLESARNWYNQLKASDFEDKNEVISRLKNQSFYQKII